MIWADILGWGILKLFALMGISTDREKQYKIIVTDNDDIIVLNLTR